MEQGLLLWSPRHPSIPFISLPVSRPKHAFSPIKATLHSTDTQQQELTARERRQLRQERRESKAGYNWREEVEERLIKKPKKKPTSRSVDLNLDTLADLGPQWYVVRVSRVRSDETAVLIARLLARNYPDLEYKVYAPSIKVKTKLKNGTYSVKPKPVFPGCVFLWCVLNKEIHDFIRECNGVGGFVGSKVGNTKRQINRPRPVSVEDMEEIFRQAKEEQEKYDEAFQEEQQEEGALNSEKLVGNENMKLDTDSNPTRGSRKISDPPVNGSPRKKKSKLLKAGSTVRVKSGTFAEFAGILKKLNRKTGEATVGFTLFGKETLVDLDLHEIVEETE
ncbi:hypothetical protein JCGZ_25075 [Jatropha curcas]|uniref:NusG-like N-terminal domain-containing protein n=1 Tax=Jatropha curcas TaxID=180498 RepID=A0A067JKJ8_JATCU|nr:transcription termination/antitermination protein NusG [Jatropha curcas]KDP24511.1 hypothetical protein JCGZ_25075 [Jatropha curcas]